MSEGTREKEQVICRYDENLCDNVGRKEEKVHLSVSL